nr:hypothetical protein [Tanacetum cinerariifolium]
MDEEIKSIEKNDTWELTTLLKGQKAIRVKWVYKATKDTKGKMEKYKVRLVVKGYKQKHDVKTTFLKGLLEEEVYVKQPERYVAKGQEGKVIRLKKALYGLKQAPRAWNTRIDKYFQGHGFTKCLSEYALYVKFENKSTLLACLYVDDLIFTGNSQSMIDELKKSMMRKFEMIDIGLMSYYLGIKVKQTNVGIFICQRDIKEVDSTLFKSLIGSLCYLTCTRPDILFAVGLISHFMKDPTIKHLKIAKRILRYIKEYVAATSCVCHGLWLRSMLKELHIEQEDATEIYVHNKSAIDIAKNPVYQDRSKHINTSYHYIRECIARKDVRVIHTSSHDQVADIFTKSLNERDFSRQRMMHGVEKSS